MDEEKQETGSLYRSQANLNSLPPGRYEPQGWKHSLIATRALWTPGLEASLLPPGVLTTQGGKYQVQSIKYKVLSIKYQV